MTLRGPGAALARGPGPGAALAHGTRGQEGGQGRNKIVGPTQRYQRKRMNSVQNGLSKYCKMAETMH